MCHTVTPVVLHTSRRKVLRCSCGAHHIIWENLNLSVQDDEFFDLYALTQQADVDSLGHWHLHRGAGGIGLWYGPFGSTFSSADFADFALLLQAAINPPALPSPPLYTLN